MIEIIDAPDNLLKNNVWLEYARQKQLHLVAPAVLGEQYSLDYEMSKKHSYGQARQNHIQLSAPENFGKPNSFACEALQDIIPINDIVRYFDEVNKKVDIGSLWPMRYVSLLPVPPHPNPPNWHSIFSDMFRVHFMKDMPFTILILLDANVYPNTAYIKTELVRAGMDYPVPNNRKNPLAYYYAED